MNRSVKEQAARKSKGSAARSRQAESAPVRAEGIPTVGQFLAKQREI